MNPSLLHRRGITGLRVVVVLTLTVVVVHALTNHRYGFHRDELAVVGDAQHLAWGYVAYPPVTPFIARVALTLFGPSLVGLRLFSSLAIGLAMILTALMARELGGSGRAQVLAAVATGIAPIALISGSLFQYVAFDYLWWVLITYLLIHLIKSENPRYWLAIGLVIGIGMMTKYTIGLLVIGIVIGVVLTPLRRQLTSPWLWTGVVLSLIVFSPNLIWQVQHDFISVDFLRAIHDRDTRIGRTEKNLLEQFLVCANIVTIPIWIGGLWSYFRVEEMRQYRILGWIFIVVLALLLLTEGRSYYIAPAYPMLFAAGAVTWERRLAQLSPSRARRRLLLRWTSMALGAVVFGAVMLPLARVNSSWWKFTDKLHDNFREEIGWPELVQTVAAIYHGLPADQKSRAAILTGNYGEAGAINLYGPARGLPQAISGVNSYWLRGYNNPPPETVIVLGFSEERLNRLFTRCQLAGHVTNAFGVKNQETTYHPNIFVCNGPREPWDSLWVNLRSFG